MSNATSSARPHDPARDYPHDWRYDDALKKQSVLHDEDEHFIRETMAVQTSHHWFVGVQRRKQPFTLAKIVPKTTAYASLTSSVKKYRQSAQKDPTLEINWGYIGENWTAYLSAFSPQKTLYISNPVLTSSLTYRFQSEIKPIVGLLHIDWDFLDLGPITLSTGTGLGGGIYLEKTTLSSGLTGVENHRRFMGAAEGDVSVKVQVYRGLSMHWNFVARTYTPWLLGPGERSQRLRLKASRVRSSGSALAIVYRYY